MDLGVDEFDALVTQAIAEVPPELFARIDNCVIAVEDFPPPDLTGSLGVYEGTPLTERGGDYSVVLPDRIVIFAQPILAICHSHADIVREVRITVIHEIAHHFGIDDDRLHELGWG